MNAKVSVIMGSSSDWEVMSESCKILTEFGIPYEKKIVSAHRTPECLYDFAKSIAGRNIQVIIAGAGGAAHLPGMTASMTEIPVLGVPVPSKTLNGIDSLYSIVQMPAGIPVGTLAIGKAGAVNAALLAVRILSLQDDSLRKKMIEYKDRIGREAIEKENELQ